MSNPPLPTITPGPQNSRIVRLPDGTTITQARDLTLITTRDELPSLTISIEHKGDGP
jgi:hypothetical protein